MADDVVVTMDREWDDGNEAKGKPRIALYDMSSPVAAVVTLAGDAFVALDFLSEGVLAAGEYQTHCEYFDL